MSLLAVSSEGSVEHVDEELVPSWMLMERTKLLTPRAPKLKSAGKCIVYWMQRDVRTVDNWALLFAQHLSKTQKIPLNVFYCLPPPPSAENGDDDDLPPKPMSTSPMPERYGSFLVGGLQLVHKELRDKKIPLHVLLPEDRDSVGTTVCEWLDQEVAQPKAVICDMSPLRLYRQWLEAQAAPLLEERKIPLIQVDAHNVVPVWFASQKREVGARTLRPKIHKLVSKFFTDYPTDDVVNFQQPAASIKEADLPAFDKKRYLKYLKMDNSVPAVAWAQPGREKGMKQFDFFVKNGLKKFDELRNDPNYGKTILSNMSPWLNHGHVSFQRLARIVKGLNKHANGTATYIEEGLVRRELSDNYCYYTPDNYDALEGAAEWARQSLQDHASDDRGWVYSLEEFETSRTHDDLWNAAQMQLVKEGKLHGFLRMYWAKKVLEWTESPEVALRTAQYLNDQYALDGLDPNGFVGVGWSIMGIHDMGWKERPIFGKIRYMNYAGCKRKFKVAEFIAKYPGAQTNAIEAAKKRGKDPEHVAVNMKKTKASSSTTSGRKTSAKKRKLK